MSSETIMFSPALLDKALSDKEFFSKVPELSSLKVASEAARNTRKTAKPCCGGRARQPQDMFPLFCSAVISLPAPALARLKSAMGVTGKLLIRGLNRRTAAYELMSL